jgi:hypothetical protein
MTDAEIKKLRKIFNDTEMQRHEAILSHLASESKLVDALIQHGEEQYAAKGIVYGCRVTANSTTGRHSFTGIYVGHRCVYSLLICPSVMKETKDGTAHKSARVSSADQDWRLADD